jgi:O-antigen/teichoic acid export membrane protein
MIRHATLIVAGNLFSRVVFASLTIAVAKLLSAEQYGAFSYAIAVVSFVSYFCELGLQNTYLRDATTERASWRGYTLASLYMRCVLFIAVCAVAFSALSWLNLAPAPKRCIELMFVPGVFGLMLTSWITGALLSRSNAWALCRARFAAALTQLVCVSAGMLVPVSSSARPGAVALAYGIGLALGGLFGIRSVPIDGFRLRVSRAVRFGSRLTKGVNAYLLSGFLYMLAPSLGVLVLEKHTALAVVGTFALASRVPQFLYTIPGSIGQAFYPRLFAAAREDQWSAWLALLFKEVLFLLAAGLLLSLTVVLSAPLVVAVLGHSNDPGYQAMLKTAVLIGAAVILLQSLSTPLGHALETAGLARLRTIGQALSLGIGGVLFAVLGARFGVPGAMAAAVATEAVLYFAWLMLLTLRIKRVDITRLLLPSLGALGCVSIVGVTAWLL